MPEEETEAQREQQPGSERCPSSKNKWQNGASHLGLNPALPPASYKHLKESVASSVLMGITVAPTSLADCQNQVKEPEKRWREQGVLINTNYCSFHILQFSGVGAFPGNRLPQPTSHPPPEPMSEGARCQGASSAAGWVPSLCTNTFVPGASRRQIRCHRIAAGAPQTCCFLSPTCEQRRPHPSSQGQGGMER